MEPEASLGDVFTRSARGEFPPADGNIRFLPATNELNHAVISFTAHSLVVTDFDFDLIRSRLPPGDLNAPMSPQFLGWFASQVNITADRPVVFHMVLCAFGEDVHHGLTLLERQDLQSHPRARAAAHYRRDVKTYSDPVGQGVVTLGVGLGGRPEVGIEVDESRRREGLGTALALAALSLVRPGQALFAQVPSGHVAAVRAFLSAGYRPICSEIQFPRTQ